MTARILDVVMNPDLSSWTVTVDVDGNRIERTAPKACDVIASLKSEFGNVVASRRIHEVMGARTVGPVTRNGQTTIPKFEPGDRVIFTSKARRTAVYIVLEKFKDEMMYGPWKGSWTIKLRLGRDATDRGFSVGATRVLKIVG